MKIASLDAFPVKLARDVAAGTGAAGLPAKLQQGRFAYHWSSTFPTLYSSRFETALVRVRTDDGLEGWGEAQAPLAPEVASSIVELLLRPAIVGEELDATPGRIAELYRRMYATMRVRGQTGGFMLDAIAGVDLALWDLAGKAAGKPAAALASPDPKAQLPAYVSGLAGETNALRVEAARQTWEQGYRSYKLFYDRTHDDLFDLIDRLQDAFEGIVIAVDALWRLDSEDAVAFGKQLDRRGILWLEAPFYPEDVDVHRRLHEAIETPLALGESYRTRHELERFFEAGVVGYLQPDLGRVGLTESFALAEIAASAGAQVVPHVSTACGPQIAAALHLAAAAQSCNLVEYNPRVLAWANRFIEHPVEMGDAGYRFPRAPGLGVGAVTPPPMG
ncbi:MAG: mandelate racemase/muconate lactonizing enzyme family protein [Acidobacteria bacterium]|nr:mandelate racemase/muconate lactonizing enzyme family protein [Acidobacteriota bacterium]